MSPGSAAVLVGLSLFVYAGYEAVQYRELLKLTAQEFDTVPLIVNVSVLLACVLCLYGSYQLSGNFKPINGLNDTRGLHGNLRTDFMSFNHRGFAMPLDVPPLK